jgi:acyl dehydratase
LSVTTEFPQLTDEMLDAARQTISKEYKERPPCYSKLTEDIIRRWAYAIGDANPLWLDPDYAAKTRWRKIVSPPTFPETAVRGAIFNPLRVQRAASTNGDAAGNPERLPGQAKSRGGGFPALAGLQVGRQFTFYAPVKADDELRGMQRVVSIVDSEGRSGGDSIEPESDVETALAFAKEECAAPKTRIAIQTFDIAVYNKSTGQLVLRDLHHMARFARGIPMDHSKYRDVPLPRYTDEQMEHIVDMHEREYLRGSKVLYWEDVKVGDELPPIVKGPHTPSDYIMYHSSFGSFFDVTDRIKYLMLKRFPGAAVVDPETNVPEFPHSMHLDNFTSRSMGYPRGFDGSMQRISWFGHLVTNWIGDDGFLSGLNIFHPRPLFLWDAMWLHGRVVEKKEADSSIRIEVWGDNQRDERISQGSATAVLQNRSGKPFPYT